jgi:hypothetical protein
LRTCSNCGNENEARYKFCRSCGAALSNSQEKPAKAAKPPSAKVCPSCQEENPEAFTFCGRCGAELNKAVEVKAPEKPKAPSSIIHCERCGKENQSHYKYCLDCGVTLLKIKQLPPQAVKEPAKEKERPPQKTKEAIKEKERPPAPKAKSKKNMTQPNSITLQKSDDWLKLVYKPNNTTYVIAFAVLSLVMLASVFSGISREGVSHFEHWGAAFFTFFGGVFLAVAAISLARELIVVELEISTDKDRGPFREMQSPGGGNELRVRHVSIAGPTFTCSCERLQQIYCAKRIPSSRSSSAVYDVTAVYDGGSAQVIVAGVYDLATAQFIEFTLESELKIEDRQVSQEAS